MADGKSHCRITLALTVTITPIVTIATLSPEKAVMFTIGCLLGLIVEPDLDVNHVTESERRMIKVFGPLAYLWIGLWLPYALIIPHRSILSHTPIVGTTIRLAYLLGWLYLLLGVLGMQDWLFIAMQANLEVLAWLVLGLIIADTGHWIADWKMFSNIWHQ